MKNVDNNFKDFTENASIESLTKVKAYLESELEKDIEEKYVKQTQVVQVSFEDIINSLTEEEIYKLKDLFVAEIKKADKKETKRL